MPVYNEVTTLTSAVKEVLNVDFPCEIELIITTIAARTAPGTSTHPSQATRV